MAKLVYTEEEILADHDYAAPHVEAGYRLHGGLDADGNYISPRMLHREPAVEAWRNALLDRGWELIDASQDLLKQGNFPNQDQASFLLSVGDGVSLWNSLTVTGIIEARGQALATITAPDFQKHIVEDISELALGHMNKGLFKAHGWDEGGRPDSGEGGHDDMWFAVRDALFGKDAYPLIEPADSIGRPDKGREMPQIGEFHEMVVSLLMNVLMIEVRAEAFFNHCCGIMRNPNNFTDRREAAMHAADLVDRIRQDEAIHVGYLQVIISELRNLTFKLEDGGTIKGAEFLDPVWEDMVKYHTGTVYQVGREQSQKDIEERLRKLDNGEELVAQFNSLATLAEAAE